MCEDGRGVEAWKEHTSAFDRVRSIAAGLTTPEPVEFIAGEACVAETTARAHLARLVDQGVIRRTEQDGTTLYAPNPSHTRMQTLQELRETHDEADLTELRADLQDHIEMWREEFDVDTPDELRARAADADDATTYDLTKVASDWELALYHLDIVEEALDTAGQ